MLPDAVSSSCKCQAGTVNWWFIDRLLKWMHVWVPNEHLKGTRMANFFYRAMGARISANCTIGDYITEFDLIELKGDIRTERVLSAAFIEEGELVFDTSLY
jgi:hypothetical protein